MSDYNLLENKVASLPSRERGLKFVSFYFMRTQILSLPSRERGLKFDELCQQYDLDEVAPLAGAWIEIVQTDTVTIVA